MRPGTDPTHWAFYKSVIDGHRLDIEDINIWEYDWVDTREHVTVKDPIYGETHVIGIYQIVTPHKTITFAAGEFSNMVWGVYLPK